jgi:hypothetical protein
MLRNGITERNGSRPWGFDSVKEVNHNGVDNCSLRTASLRWSRPTPSLSHLTQPLIPPYGMYRSETSISRPMPAQGSKPTLAPNRKLHSEGRPAFNPGIFHVTITIPKVCSPLNGSTPAVEKTKHTSLEMLKKAMRHTVPGAQVQNPSPESQIPPSGAGSSCFAVLPLPRQVLTALMLAR